MLKLSCSNIVFRALGGIPANLIYSLNFLCYENYVTTRLFSFIPKYRYAIYKTNTTTEYRSFLFIICKQFSKWLKLNILKRINEIWLEPLAYVILYIGYAVNKCMCINETWLATLAYYTRM